MRDAKLYLRDIMEAMSAIERFVEGILGYHGMVRDHEPGGERSEGRRGVVWVNQVQVCGGEAIETPDSAGLGISRHTVDRYCEDATVPWKKPEWKAPVMTEKVISFRFIGHSRGSEGKVVNHHIKANGRPEMFLIPETIGLSLDSFNLVV